MAQVVFYDETGFQTSVYGAPTDVAKTNYAKAVERFKKGENHEGHFAVALVVDDKEVDRYPAKKAAKADD